MAKDKQSDGALFSPDFRRRHPHLILPKLLTEKAMCFPFDPQRLQSGLSVLAHWADLAEKGALRQKETSLDSEFLRVIFGQALGYQTVSDNPNDYTMEKNPTVSGAGQADGSLGFFTTGRKSSPVAIIECKDATTSLDHDRFNGRTPVQQLSDYMAQLPDTPWGILTNYLTVRLYHKDSPMRAFQEFPVAGFKDPDKAREFLYLFEPDGLLGQPPLQRARALELLRESVQRRLTVGDRLYDYYADQRFALIGTLRRECHYSTDDAIHAAQRLLDRIIFIAFCADRGLLPYQIIENVWEGSSIVSRATNPRWRAFLDLFYGVDKGHRALKLDTGYNGGLFRHDPLVDDLQLDDEPWTDVFRIIGEYDFREEGEINVDVLGHLFEKSVTELEKLRVLGLFGQQADAAAEPAMPKSALRKRFGIYYTPPQFTQFIVEKTLGQLITDRIEPLGDVAACVAALRKLRVVDPACGSGAFLIAAYDVFEAAYEVLLHRLREERRSDEAAQLQQEYPNWILSENLFGVDLSMESVEITQLALWIRSARKGRTLADLSKNIVCGNSLVADSSVSDRALDWKATFPEVFAAGSPRAQSRGGGFDCVIGNPPWERIKQQKREFFANTPEVVVEHNAAKARTLIEGFAKTNPELFKKWNDSRDQAAKTAQYIRDCGAYPLTGRGDMNYAMLFAELSRQLVAPTGMVGLLVPSGVATDDTTKHFFNNLMETKALSALYDFENHDRVFPDVDGRFKFCVLLLKGRDRHTGSPDFVFFARGLDDLKPRSRHIALTALDLQRLNPNTRTCPIFRTRRDLELTKRLYWNVPILIDKSRKAGGNPWGLQLGTMYHQSADANLFVSAESLRADGFHAEGNRWVKGKESFLPLYEAKMVQTYDHRAAGVVIEKDNWARQGQTRETALVSHQDPEFVVLPRFWVAKNEVAKTRFTAAGTMAYKNITSATNQRTMIAAFLPYAAYVDSINTITFDESTKLRRRCCFLANLNALVYDYVVRQKVGGLHLSHFIVEQLPTFGPDQYDKKCPWDKKVTLEKWISERVLKLTCTADDMRPLAEAAGFKQGVYKWDPAERAALRAELDAAYFYLYGLDRQEVNYVLGQFQGVVNEDAADGQPGPTRRGILEAYDALAEGVH